jgi:two-component system, chemotaxis family, protein-glutamate methylesterase/glutaminase
MATGNLLIIGSSTGGPKILEELLPKLPVLRTAVLIVQHITAFIDKAFVTSLGRVSPMPVHLAAESEQLQSGHVYVAPGGIHLLLANNERVQLRAGEPVNSVRPSIDVAMKSLVKPSARMVGVILTGMGRDGADGIKHMKQLGATIIAQDQSTSVIYGMPKAAAETGCVDFVLSTQRIADKLRELF